MNIILYDTNSPKNAINKILKNPVSKVIHLKEKFDLANPYIYIKSDKPITKNYCYIDDFKRYYFIDEVEIFPNKIYRLTLNVDVLESFKDDILKSKCKIKVQVETNDYYNMNYESEVKKECKLFYSNKSVKYVPSNIIVTIGG